jgi:hypothetical protein
MKESGTETAMDVVKNIGLMVLAFTATILVQVPVIQSIWDMMVFRYYPHHLATGIILFVLLMKSVWRYRTTPSTESTSPAQNLANLIGFYVTLMIIWATAYLYTLFI